MFKKKECKNCRKKIDKKNNFCPNCGFNLNGRRKTEDWGMLGKNDILDLSNEIRLPMGLGTLFNSLMKNLENQFKEIDSNRRENFNQEIPKKQGVSISISTSGNNPPRIKINQFGNPQKGEKIQEGIKNIPMKNFSHEQIKKLSKLPRKEPQTEMKRLSDSVIYEIEVPGVKSFEDISIAKLENSIEITAIGKSSIYKKLIPVNLPIVDYDLSKGKLILKLGTE